MFQIPNFKQIYKLRAGESQSELAWIPTITSNISYASIGGHRISFSEKGKLKRARARLPGAKGWKGTLKIGKLGGSAGAGFLALRTQEICVDEFSSNADKIAEPYLSHVRELFLHTQKFFFWSTIFRKGPKFVNWENKF